MAPPNNANNRQVKSQKQSERPSNNSSAAARPDGPAYESSSSKKLINEGNQDDQIKEKGGEVIDHHDDGVPRIIMSRNGPTDKSQDGLINGRTIDHESIQHSIDAQTQAIPRDQMSIYASHKDFRSEVGLRKQNSKDAKGGLSDAQTKVDTPSNKQYLKVKGLKVEDEILVRGIKELPEPENDN